MTIARLISGITLSLCMTCSTASADTGTTLDVAQAQLMCQTGDTTCFYMLTGARSGHYFGTLWAVMADLPSSDPGFNDAMDEMLGYCIPDHLNDFDVAIELVEQIKLEPEDRLHAPLGGFVWHTLGKLYPCP